MDRRMLSDGQWLRIETLLPGKPTDKGGGMLIIDSSWKRSYIPPALATLGATCLRSLAIGTRCMYDLPAGKCMGFGIGSPKR